MRRLAAIALLIAASALTACGGGSSSSTGATTAPATTGTQAQAVTSAGTSTAGTSTAGATSGGAIQVKFQAPSTPPKAGENWPVTITAHTAGGKPVGGTVSYAFLFGGRVVATRPGGHMTNGTFHDELKFPARAAGIPITLRVVVRSHGQEGITERRVTVRS